MIRVALGLSETSPAYIAMKKFADLLARQTDGCFDVKIFHSSQLGDDAEILDKLRNGSLDMTLISSTPVAAIAKELMLFDFPFLLKDEQVVDTGAGKSVWKKYA